MKIKVRPEDFVVQEQAEVELDPRPGPFAVFELSKRQWDSFDLLALLARRLGVERRDIRLAGLKDRFGDTAQLVSVRVPGRPPGRLPLSCRTRVSACACAAMPASPWPRAT